MGIRSNSKGNTLSVIALWDKRFDARILAIFQNAISAVGIPINVIGIDSEAHQKDQWQAGVHVDMTIDAAAKRGLAQTASHVLLPCDYCTFRQIEDEPKLNAFLTQLSNSNAHFIGDSGVVGELVLNKTAESSFDWIYNADNVKITELAKQVARELLSVQTRGKMN